MKFHHKQEVALTCSLNDLCFKHSKLEVIQVLFFGNEFAKAKASYNLLAMVYVELRLCRKVDRKTVVIEKASS